MRTGSQAAGLLLVPRGLRVLSRVRPRDSTLNHPRGLSCQRGGLENSFRSGRFLRFRLAFLPCRSKFKLPRPDRGADSFSVASGMLTSHWDGKRVRWSSPLQGGRTVDARVTTDTRLPAAEMVGPGLQSRRVERAKRTDPSPAPEDVTKHNDSCPTPGSEVQPHPRTGQGRLRRSYGKTWNPGVVRGPALFLNLFLCEAGPLGSQPVMGRSIYSLILT